MNYDIHESIHCHICFGTLSYNYNYKTKSTPTCIRLYSRLNNLLHNPEHRQPYNFHCNYLRILQHIVLNNCSYIVAYIPLDTHFGIRYCKNLYNSSHSYFCTDLCMMLYTILCKTHRIQKESLLMALSMHEDFEVSIYIQELAA